MDVKPGKGFWFAIVALALSPTLFLLVVWALKIKPAVATAESLNATMGTIFTAGGLVVALVSIYTMFNVAAVAKAAVKPTLDQLPKIVNQRIQVFLKAFEEYQLAKAALERYSYAGLDYAEELVKSALALEPALSGCYNFMGDAYYRAAGLKYLQDRAPGDLAYNAHLPDNAAVSTLASKAAHWLEKAAAHRDGTARELAAELAMIYGMLQWRREVITNIKTAFPANGDNRPNATQLGFLFGACKSEKDIKQVAKALSLDLPLSAEQTRALATKHYAERQNIVDPLTLIVIPKHDPLGIANPRSPGLLTVYDIQGPPLTGAAQWVTMEQQVGMPIRKEGIPALEYDEHQAQRQQPQLPFSELLERIIERFYVIAKHDWAVLP